MNAASRDFDADSLDSEFSLDALLRKVEGWRRNGTRFVLCHGRFDPLHVGHVLHFAAAKRPGEALAVTITPDQFSAKDVGRPFQTQTLRAAMVESLKLVDAVAINRWPDATHLLDLVRPDAYAKGSDYISADDSGYDKEAQTARRLGIELRLTQTPKLSATEVASVLARGSTAARLPQVSASNAEPYVPAMNVARENQLLRGDILAAMSGVFEHGQFMLGPEVAQFESAASDFLGVKHAVAVNSGTDALLFALKAAGVTPGAEIITAANSFIATAGAARQLGAVVRFCDVGDDENLDPEKLARSWSPRVKAVVAVHLRGRPAAIGRLKAVTNQFGVPLIEDASQAFGACLENVRVGAFGFAGCFSLHPQKVLGALGDAGLLVTNDPAVAASVRLWRHHGLQARDSAVVWGQNSRLDSLQAAALLVKLGRVPEWIERRRAIARRYTQAFSGAGLVLPVEEPGEYSVYYHYSVFTPLREALMRHLHAAGVDARVHYPIPIHLQMAAAPGTIELPPGGLPNTERQARTQLSLPIHHDLTESQVDRVISAVREFFETAGRGAA